PAGRVRKSVLPCRGKAQALPVRKALLKKPAGSDSKKEGFSPRTNGTPLAPSKVLDRLHLKGGLDGSKATASEGHAGANGRDRERDGADRARRVSLDYLPVAGGGDGAGRGLGGERY